MSTTTTHPARAHRAATLRAARTARHLRRAAYDAAHHAVHTQILAGALPPLPPEGTPTPEFMLWFDRARAIEDHDPATIAARAAADQAERTLAGLTRAYRTAYAPLMRPADPGNPNDAYSLRAATTGETPLPTWDDGWGPLWLVLEEFGPWLMPCGIVRARTWEDAYSCAEDEVIPDFDWQAHGIDPTTYDPETDDEPEGLTYRGSGTPSNSTSPGGARLQTPYADSNGITLRRLTHDDLAVHGITIHWTLGREDYPTVTPTPTA